jgi:trk system potassium uptake protein
MYVIIAGCRKVGSNLAMELSQENHDVVVIDSDPSHLETLGSGFNGVTIVGMPIDEDVLRSAGAEQADALAAVTDDDNMNIMVSQVAKELFHVPVVVTRVYDPQRESIMEGMGLTTVCPTTLAVKQIKRRLTNLDTLENIRIGNTRVSLKLVKPPRKLIGKPLADYRDEPSLGIMRDHVFFPMTLGETVRANDQLVVAEFSVQEA